jgi:hypothetical protein
MRSRDKEFRKTLGASGYAASEPDFTARQPRLEATSLDCDGCLLPAGGRLPNSGSGTDRPIRSAEPHTHKRIFHKLSPRAPNAARLEDLGC